jgi:hypothetical protein
VANSRDKASTIAGTWSNGDLGATEPSAEPDSLLIPADDDPLENLFRADQTLRAPSIPAAPSEAEVTRWRATVRTSMFDENVSDPVPAAPEPPPVARVAGPILGATAGPVRPPPVVRRIDLLQPSSRPPPPAGRAPATPPPPPPAATRDRSKASGRSGVRSKTEPAQPEPPAPQALDLTQREPQPAPARRRRVQRGPKPALLAALAVAALLVVGTVAVLIGLVDNPLAPRPPQRVVAMLAPPAAKPPRPAPVAKQPAPVQAAPGPAKPAAAVEPSAPAAAVAPPAPAAAAQPAAKVEPEQAKPAAAQPAPEPQPVEAPPAVAAAPAGNDTARPAQAAKSGAETSAQSPGAAALLTSARKFLADDEPARAEAAMRELLAQDPQDHHAMELLVRALMDQDRGPEAVPFARKMVSRRGKRVAYRLLLGDVLLMAGDESGARAEWQAALELAPEDREIKRRLGM